MTRGTQLTIEVHYVALSANELEERRARLRALLLTGAMRLVQQQLLSKP